MSFIQEYGKWVYGKQKNILSLSGNHLPELKGCFCKSRRPNKPTVAERSSLVKTFRQSNKTSQFAHMMSGAVCSTIVGAHRDDFRAAERSHFHPDDDAAQGAKAKMLVRIISSVSSQIGWFVVLVRLRLLVFGATQTLGLVGSRSKLAMPH
jgi:hypothetical protein